jgi:iron complex transport system ATP-binding protein
MSSIIEIENLSFSYVPQAAILKDINLQVSRGTFVSIAGPNGAGKTTLLNLLCGLLSPQAGTIKIDTAPVESYSVKELAQKVAVVRQEFVPVFDFTVTQVVAMARAPYVGTFGFENRIDKEIVAEAIEMTEVVQFASRPLAKLSSGERQRVFIARAIAQDTPILLLDEPTSFLDLKHQVGIYDLLKRMQLEKGKTIVAVTHDINLSAQYCDETVLLGAGSGYYIGKAKDVFSVEKIEEIFGVRTFAGKVGQEKFFIPLGKFAKDNQIIASKLARGQQK